MSALEIDTRDETAEQDLSTLPGLRLREAREKAKLSKEEVSASLRLDMHLVEALEKDDYASLPAATFVRGYLRGYARLLNLPDAPIIEAYDRHGFDSPLLVADITTRPQVKSGDMPVRLVTYSVVVVMLLLMVLWWQTQSSDSSFFSGFSFSGEAEKDTAETAVPALIDDTEPLPEPSMPQFSAAPAMDTMAEGPPDVSESGGLSALEADVAEPAVAAIALPETSIEAEPVVTGDAGLSESELTAGPQPVVVTEPQPADPEVGSVVIKLNRDSWIEVYDADNERLFYGTAREGNTVSVTGKTPMRLLIGYASGVEIEYNGQPFDHKPFSDKGVARFSLGN